MGSLTAAGATLALSAAAPATQDAAGYAALAWTVVGGIDKIGAIGAVYNKVEFQPLNGPKEKHKGSRDNGSLAPSMAWDKTDAGQVLMVAAAASNSLYSVKVTYADGTKRYSQGRVFGMPETVDGADSVIMVNPTIELISDIVPV